MSAMAHHPKTTAKATVIVLRHPDVEMLPLEFLLTRADFTTVVFTNDHELDNWLCHCVDTTTPLLAAIIDSTSFERRNYQIDCKSALASRNIPLLVVDSARHNSNWSRFEGNGSKGLTLYLATLNLLPQLLNQIQEQGGNNAHLPKEGAI